MTRNLCGLLASQRDAFEPLELADKLLDPRTPFVEDLWEAFRAVLCDLPHRDDRHDALGSGRTSIALGVVAFVRQRGPWRDVGAELEEQWKLWAVAGLAAGQVKGEWLTVEVGLEVDLGREATARTSERLALLPPFAPAAETWARTVVLSNICTRCAVGLRSANTWKNASKTPLRLSRENRFQTVKDTDFVARVADLRRAPHVAIKMVEFDAYQLNAFWPFVSSAVIFGRDISPTITLAVHRRHWQPSIRTRGKTSP